MQKVEKKVAFFDIDGTVFRSSLLVRLVEELSRLGIFPTVAKQGYQKELLKWQNREGSYDAYINAVVKTFLLHIKGVHYGTFLGAGRQVVAQHRKQVYRFTRDLILNLKRDKYFIVAISQSPKAVLDIFCQEYGFDKVYGRIYEIGPTDCFTGQVEGEHIIANKANIVKRVQETESVTMAESIAVGDTDGDIPMLELVEQPICFNPSATLFAHAQRMGWKVYVERKDVVYEL